MNQQFKNKPPLPSKRNVNIFKKNISNVIKNEEYIKINNNIKKILSYYTGNSNISKEELRLLKAENSKHKCIVMGNGPSLNNINLELLNNHITIGCNSLYVGLIEKRIKFTPTILCSGNFSTGKFIMEDYYTYIINDKEILEPIIVLHPSLLLTFDRKIIYDKNYKNLFYISNITRFKLTQNVDDINFELIKKNIKNYCSLYKNVVAMISLSIAERLGFKQIYMIGVDYNKNRLDHYYTENEDIKKSRYSIDDKEINAIKSHMEGFKKRYEELKEKNINLYLENKDSSINFLPYFDISKLYI